MTRFRRYTRRTVASSHLLSCSPASSEPVETEFSRTEVTALILAGGRSERLGGVDKCSLDIGGASLIERRISALRPVVREIIIVGGDPARAARGVHGQDPGIRAASDDPESAGPLAGLRAGLRQSTTPWVFATACDMPFFEPRLYFRLLSERGGHDAVVPAIKGWYEPLFAFYHTRCLEAIAATIRQGAAKIAAFYPLVRAHFMPAETLREQDPELLSFFNVNTDEDLATARRMTDPRSVRGP